MTVGNTAPLVLDGWFILHQFFRLLPEREGSPPGRAEALGELGDLIAAVEDPGPEGWSGLYRTVGGGAGLMAIHFRDSLEALGRAERILQDGPASSYLALEGDYVSVVELSLYHLTAALAAEAEERGVGPGSEEWRVMVDHHLAEERAKRYVQERLHPVQPEGLPYVCFYPMDKRRNEGQNWYGLPLGDRAGMMRDHGSTGRRYAGRISQVISGSMGLDDWEWAVTLFGRSPNDFKELIAEMRYDEVSAVYAEFGSFRVGYRIPAEGIAAAFGGAG